VVQEFDDAEQEAEPEVIECDLQERSSDEIVEAADTVEPVEEVEPVKVEPVERPPKKQFRAKNVD